MSKRVASTVFSLSKQCLLSLSGVIYREILEGILNNV